MSQQRKCDECGAELVLMNFGFAGDDWECQYGPWGSGEHDSHEMRMHRAGPVLASLCFYVTVLMLFLVLVFAQ